MAVPSKLSVPQILKLFTTVPKKFIDDFFSLYDYENPIKATDYTINLEKLAKWLDVPKFGLSQTLHRNFKKDLDYTEKLVKRPANSVHKYGNNHKKIMITPECMKRMCMSSRSPRAEMVRTYFINIEEFLFHYKDQIVDGLMREIQDLAVKERRTKANDGPGLIYIIRASEVLTDIFKVGQTMNEMKKRLRTYNTGRAKDLEPLYTYFTPYRREVERCLKRLLKGKQYKKGREIYEIDNEIIAKLIQGCGQLSMKLHYANPKSTLNGKYYIIFEADIPDTLKKSNKK